MPRGSETSAWRGVLLTAVALVALTALAFSRAPNEDTSRDVAAMAVIFHAVMLGVVVTGLARLGPLTAARPRWRGASMTALAVATAAGAALLARDFDII